MVRSSTRTPTNSHSPPVKSCSSNTPLSCASISIYLLTMFALPRMPFLLLLHRKHLFGFQGPFQMLLLLLALRVSPPEVPRVLCTCMSHAIPSLFFLYIWFSSRSDFLETRITSFWSLLGSPTEHVPQVTLPSCWELQCSVGPWNAGRVKACFGIKVRCELKSVLETGEEQKWHE